MNRKNTSSSQVRIKAKRNRKALRDPLTLSTTKFRRILRTAIRQNLACYDGRKNNRSTQREMARITKAVIVTAVLLTGGDGRDGCLL